MSHLTVSIVVLRWMSYMSHLTASILILLVAVLKEPVTCKYCDIAGGYLI